MTDSCWKRIEILVWIVVINRYLIYIIGLSCKTQEIYLIVFCMRYADLFMYYVSLYNTLMKIFFISATAFIIFMIRFKKPYCTVSKISKWSNPMPCSWFLKITRVIFTNIQLNTHINTFYLSIDLWRYWWRFPTSYGLATSCPRFDMHRSIRMDSMGTRLELQSLARVSCLLATDYHA